jgi:hypothetical protein
MKKTFLTSIAVLLMATGAAHASRCVTVLPNVDPEWNCHTPESRCEQLNMREKPNTKSKILLKLDPGDIVRLDDDPTLVDLFKKWKRIYLIRNDMEIYGWIYIKYTKPDADCANARGYSHIELEPSSQNLPPTGRFEPVPQGTWKERQ